MQKLFKNALSLLIVMMLIGLIPMWVTAEAECRKTQLKWLALMKWRQTRRTRVIQFITIWLLRLSRWNSLVETHLIDNKDNTRKIVEANNVKKF